MLAKETAAERDEGRKALLKELAAIDAALEAHGGGGSDGSGGGVPSVGGPGGVSLVDLSLVPKLEHTLVAGRHLAEPPFAPFAGGALARVQRYYSAWKKSKLCFQMNISIPWRHCPTGAWLPRTNAIPNI